MPPAAPLTGAIASAYQSCILPFLFSRSFSKDAVQHVLWYLRMRVRFTVLVPIHPVPIPIHDSQKHTAIAMIGGLQNSN